MLLALIHGVLHTFHNARIFLQSLGCISFLNQWAKSGKTDYFMFLRTSVFLFRDTILKILLWNEFIKGTLHIFSISGITFFIIKLRIFINSSVLYAMLGP